MPDSPQTGRFRLGDLTVDLGTRQVWREGVELPLTGLSFDLLCALMAVGTRVLSIDELMDRVWPGRVVNAETVGKRVELVREALGDNSQEPRYIALVRGRGYRLLHAPQALTAQHDIAAGAPASAQPAVNEAAAATRGRRGLVAAIVAVVSIAAVTIFFWWQRPRDIPAAPRAAADRAQSIAVLPFLNLSEDAANSYFSDGMAEELMTRLSKMPELRVASRTSAFAFRGSNQPLPRIAQQLKVDHIVEGSVRKVGNRIRVTIQLIDVRSDSHLWAETYDRELADILEIQSEIAEKITGALKVEMSQDARARLGAGTRNAEAWQLYARGHQLWQARTEESIRQSIALLNRAIELDANFAQAHASLAAAHLISYFWYMHPDPSAFELSEAAAIRATALDPRLSQPHAVRGEIAFAHFQWSLAETRLRYALELDPNDSQAGYWLAETLAGAGRSRDALALLLKYEPQDPISPVLIHDIAHMYARFGDEARACAYFKRATEVSTSPYPWQSLAECYARAGNLAAAEEAEGTAQRILGLRKPIFTLVRLAKSDPAAAAEARTAIMEEIDRRRIYLSKMLWRLGDLDGALAAIERHASRNDINSLRDLWWRDAQDLRAHPRFRSLVEKIGLVDYWRKSGWPDVCRPAGESFTCD